MTHRQLSTLLLFSLVWSLHLCYGIPIYESLDEIPSSINSVPGFVIFLISAAIILLVSYLIIGCVCCPNKSIKALTYQNGFPVSRLNDNNPLQFENPTEFAIFPPHSAVIDLQPVSLAYPAFDDKVTFEPLPDILPRRFSGQSAACSSRPAHFRALLKTKVSLHDWFDDPNSNFPRDHLQYISELGNGWFGRVVEGEAGHISNDEEKTAVIVKILREEASPSEHLHFLHEVRPYRDLSHPNVVRLLGRCLESDPFLLIMEHSISDLKSYLVQQENKDSLLKNGIPLQMACNIAAGLRCLHENGFTHMDFAAHNCFVCSDFSVKVGDYGTSFDRWREDYYCLGEIALPIRWCSPETLLCTEATIETKEISKEANIWAFGVVLWEIFEFGKLPYEELTNEEVLQKVLIDRNVQLEPPTLEFPIKEEMSLIMKECWKAANSRPPMEKIEKFLTRLYNDRHNLKTLEASFEERWNALQHKVHEVKSISSDGVSLKFENDFSERSDSRNYSSDCERFSSFEASYDIFSKNINGQLSPSLRVLNGSIDELTENDCLSSVSMGCERSASATSDRTLSNLDDDGEIGEMVTPERILGDVRNQDTSHVRPSVDASRQLMLQTHQQNSYNNNLAEASGLENLPYNINISSAKNAVENQNGAGSLAFKSPNIIEPNELKSLDDNYNELPSSLENDVVQGSVDTNENVRNASISAKELSQSSANSHGFVTKIENKASNLELDLATSVNDEMKRDRSHTLSSVPDIVVHESPSVFESAHDENENFVLDSTEVTPTNESPKAFRFVFKEESTSTVDSKDSQKETNSERTSDSQNTPDVGNDSSGIPPVLKGRPHPLTSTPMKSTSDINGSNESPVSFTHHDDSGNVFYVSSISEIESGKSESKTPPNPGSQFIDDIELRKQSDLVEPIGNEVPGTITSNGTLYYEVPSSKTDTTYRIIESSALEKENSLCEQENFVSAQSTFHVNKFDAISNSLQGNNDVSNLKGSPVKVLDRAENLKSIIVNIPTVSVEREDDCALPSVEAESLDKDYKWPSFQEIKSDTFSEDPHKLVTNEDLLSLDYGEPVTPDVSFNISSCSYENEGRTFSTSSPGISSENIKDSEESEYETSGSKEIRQKRIDTAARNQHHSGRNFIAAEGAQNNLTLSEASSAEFLDSYSPNSDSFAHSEENRMESVGNLRGGQKSGLSNFSTNRKTDLFYDEDDFEYDSGSDTNALKSKGELRLHPYDEVIVEDLETGEQTIITESFSACDDYENSAESDEILKINTETDEAIIVDSSQALIGFVPSRSIEMLQDCEIISNMNPLFQLDEERESSDSNHFDASNSASPSPARIGSSPCQSPDSTYPLHPPYRNFSLQNEVIEEEITDEIATPSSIRSTASFSSNELYGGGDERMSSASDSLGNDAVVERSVMPTVDHYYEEESPVGGARNGKISEYDDSDTDHSECSPVRQNINGHLNGARYAKDSENNHLRTDVTQDIMYCTHPSQTVRWHSDDTLDIERGSPVVLEGREILAGGMLETRGMSVKDITTALNQLEVDDQLSRLSVSRTPSPYSSVESSPCREAYTPDFESEDSSDDESPSSCSSTSGSFECIHNKFKDSEDISKAVVDEEVMKEEEYHGGRRQSPLKIFSKTWDCHATPTKGVLVTPEKKFNSLRKSVSFHEDPQVVFEYPPCSDSEDGPVSEEINPWKVDYGNYADWELQVGDNEEIEEVLEIEELDSEPYVRRPTYGFGSSLGPMNRPMLYSLTTGFSDDDMDFSDPIPPESAAPSNSPEEGKQSSLSEDQIGNLIRSQLNNLALEESRLKWMQDVLDQQSSKFAPDKFEDEHSPSVQTDDPISEQEIVIEEILPGSKATPNVERSSSDIGAIIEDNDITDYWEDKFSKDKKFPSKIINEQFEEKPINDSYYSKLRLNTLVTLEESKSLDSFPSPASAYSDTNSKEHISSVYKVSNGDEYHFENDGKDYGQDVNMSMSNRLRNIDADQKICDESTLVNILDIPTDNKFPVKDDITQSISLELDSKDSVNYSGGFLLSSDASSVLDCPDMNGLSEPKYFDLNDTSIVHTESDNSDFMSSLEVKNWNAEKELSKLQKSNATSSQREEIIPTLDFLNADLLNPIVQLSESSATGEMNRIEVLPLALDAGNKRPNSLKFKVPYCEKDNAVEDGTEQDLLVTKEFSKSPELIENSSVKNILPSVPSENITLIEPLQNVSMDLQVEKGSNFSVLDYQKPEINVKNIDEAIYLPAKQNPGVLEAVNEDIQNTFSYDLAPQIISEISGGLICDNSKMDSVMKEHSVDPNKISSILLESKDILPGETASAEILGEDLNSKTINNDNSVSKESTEMKENISSDECLQIGKGKSSAVAGKGSDEGNFSASKSNKIDKGKSSVTESNGIDERKSAALDSNGIDEGNSAASDNNGIDEGNSAASDNNGIDEGNSASSDGNGIGEGKSAASDSNGINEGNSAASDSNGIDEEKSAASDSNGTDEEKCATDSNEIDEGNSAASDSNEIEEVKCSDSNEINEVKFSSTETKVIEEVKSSTEDNEIDKQHITSISTEDFTAVPSTKSMIEIIPTGNCFSSSNSGTTVPNNSFPELKRDNSNDSIEEVMFYREPCFVGRDLSHLIEAAIERERYEEEYELNNPPTVFENYSFPNINTENSNDLSEEEASDSSFVGRDLRNLIEAAIQQEKEEEEMQAFNNTQTVLKNPSFHEVKRKNDKDLIEGEASDIDSNFVSRDLSHVTEDSVQRDKEEGGKMPALNNTQTAFKNPLFSEVKRKNSSDLIEEEASNTVSPFVEQDLSNFIEDAIQQEKKEEEKVHALNSTQSEKVLNPKDDCGSIKVVNEFSPPDSSGKCSDFVKESALDLVAEIGAEAKAQDTKDNVPHIVVTPASESEIEDELEEYLRNQLKLCHGPESGEDFSVTSKFTARPFDDVFGNYNVPEASKDYSEAYNFEFESGDFFEDFVDDFASGEGSNEIQRWDLTSDPPMVERSSGDDLTEKQESSPLGYVSNNSTHL